MVAEARFVRFAREGQEGYGFLQGNAIADLTRHYGPDYPTLKEVIAAGRLHELAQEAANLPAQVPLSEVRFLPPLGNPGKIICVGVNYPDRNAEYRDGKAEQQYPSLFVRFPRSFVGHQQALIRPRVSEQLDYEGELVLVIGKAGRHIRERDAFGHIAGVTLANEGTVRDWVRHARFNVTQGKNFDASGSLGPWIVPFAGREQIADIRLTTKVNDELRQDDRTGRMIFDFAYLLAYISTFTTLEPGDLILTGTPTGAGARLDPPQWLKPGDRVEVEAEGIGRLVNTVADEGETGGGDEDDEAE